MKTVRGQDSSREIMALARTEAVERGEPTVGLIRTRDREPRRDSTPVRELSAERLEEFIEDGDFRVGEIDCSER